MAINKLTALNRGNPLNSNGAQLVETVNSVIDEIEIGLPSTIDAVAARTTTLEGEVDALQTEVGNLDELFISVDEEVNLQAQSKASFLTNSEQRKREYAGSGFAEWGKSLIAAPNFLGVNEGLWTNTSVSNNLRFGRGDGSGISRTSQPFVVVDGVKHSIGSVYQSVASSGSVIRFPPAPDGTKTYNSATGVVTEHASAAEAFEGLVTNGDFRGGLANWDLEANVSGSTVTNGILNYVATSNGSNFVYQPVSTTNGLQYRVEITCRWVSGGDYYQYVSGGTNAEFYVPTDGKYHKFTLILTSGTSTTQGLRLSSVGAGVLDVASISVMPATESVITSRKDLVFLETWHEAISDKDQVYPLGNVQYGATTYEGITLLTRNDGYTRFGEWDTTTTGRYSVWSTLTDAQKRVYINDPENNIYYDSEADELIQVRYRVRVVEGLGDVWANVIANELGDLAYGQVGNTAVGVRGTVVNITEYVSGGSTARYTNTRSTSGTDNEIGRFVPFTAQNSHTTCFAVPVALVQR